MIPFTRTVLTGLFALITAFLLALAPVAAKPASGGYQLFEPAALADQHAIQLAALENFDYHAKIAPECCNATKGTIDTDLVSFGRNTNQEYHTWRHIDDIGMDRTRVQSAILGDIPTDLLAGPHRRTITVDGTQIEYRMFKFDDGTFNVGSIFDK